MHLSQLGGVLGAEREDDEGVVRLLLALLQQLVFMHYVDGRGGGMRRPLLVWCGIAIGMSKDGTHAPC